MRAEGIHAAVLIAGVALSIGICGAVEAKADSSTEPRVQVSLTSRSVYDRFDQWAGEGAAIWCADPVDRRNLFGVTNSVNPEPARFFHVGKYSSDGGRTWNSTLVPTIGEPFSDYDPACAYGISGQAFFGWMSWSKDRMWSYYVSRTDDHGKSWREPARLPYERILDRGFLAVDRGRSRFRGRLYAAGATLEVEGRPSTPFGPAQILVFSSDDSGASFGTPVGIPTGVVDDNGLIHMGQIAVLEDGTLAVSWTEGDFWGSTGMFDHDPQFGGPESLPGRSVVKFSKSLDGGKTFEAPVVVAKGRTSIMANGKSVEFAKWYPSLVADETGGRHSGHLYMAWNGVVDGRVEVLLSRSADGGKSWSNPKPIVERPAFDSRHRELGPYSGMVTLAVNKHGVLGAFFYSQERFKSTELWPVFTASVDGGENWTRSVHLTRQPLLPDPYVFAILAGYGKPPLPPKPAYFGWPPTCYYGLILDADGQFRLFALSSRRRHLQIDSMAARVRVLMP